MVVPCVGVLQDFGSLLYLLMSVIFVKMESFEDI